MRVHALAIVASLLAAACGSTGTTDSPTGSTTCTVTGVAVSATPCGPYTYLGATRPLGHPSRDLGLFKDDDGTAYMIHEDPAAGMRIERLAAFLRSQD